MVLCNACLSLCSPFMLPQRYRATILFADIVQSTRMIAGLDPEEAADLLDKLLQPVQQAIGRHGGTVCSVEGDGLMAAFGVEPADEDHALRACAAALDMCKASTEALLRVGISSGDILVRPVSQGLSASLSATGPPTHMASKAQRAAAPGSIHVVGLAFELVRDRIDWTCETRLELAGFDDPVRGCMLSGLKPWARRFDLSRRRGLSSFVGRESEMGRMMAMAQTVQQRHAMAVAILGEPGVGKTRLCWELRALLAAQGWRVIGAASAGRISRTPYATAYQLICALHDLDVSAAGQSWLTQLRRRLPEAELDLAALHSMLDLAVDDPLWARLESTDRRARVRRCLLRLVELGLGATPMAMLVEDLHWIDGESLAFIGELPRRLRDRPLMVVLDGRTEAAAALQDFQPLEQIRLAPLAQAESQAMLGEHLGADPSTLRIRPRLQSLGGGNPFFIEELVRMLVDQGVLVGDPGCYRHDAAAGSVGIPASIHDVLAVRIARLQPEPRWVLQCAAVLGRQVSTACLSDLSGLEADRLQELLVALVDGCFLMREIPASTSQGEIAFCHAFTWEVAYASMPQRDRIRLHALALQALEAGRWPLPSEQPDLLAQHALAAQDWPRSILHLDAAVQRAVRRWAMRDSIRLIDEALQRVVPQLEDSAVRARWEIDLRLLLRGPLVALGQVERVTRELETARALAEGLGDEPRWARVAVYVCGHHWFRGEILEAIRVGQRALRGLSAQSDERLAVPLRQYLGGALHAAGEHVQAQALLTANVDTVAELDPGAKFGMAGFPAVFCRGTRCWSLEQTGDFAGAQVDAQASMRIARQSGNGFSIQGAAFACGHLMLSQGRWGEARDLLLDAMKISERERHGMWLPLLGPLASIALARIGEPAQARAMLDRTVPDPRSPILTTFVRLAVVDAMSLLDRQPAAQALAEETLQRAERLGERLWAAELRRALGLLLVLQGGAVAAERGAAHLRHALREAASMGMPPLQVRCLVGLSATCDVGEAVQLLDEADHLAAPLGWSWGSRLVKEARARLAPAG